MTRKLLTGTVDRKRVKKKNRNVSINVFSWNKLLVLF